MFNSFGQLLRMTTFGESHGAGLGCVVDGCPSGITTDESLLHKQLQRRRPGQSEITSSRAEEDIPEILSGIFENKTLGTPIAIIVRNKDQRPGDYDKIRKQPRPGHADQTWSDKFVNVDYRGGGRASGRETVSRVMAGWVAESLLNQLCPELRIVAHVESVGEISLPEDKKFGNWSRDQVDKSSCRCPDAETASEIENMLLHAKQSGDSYGGEVVVTVTNVPASLGEPVFLKTQNYISQALTSIGTVNCIYWNEKPLSLSGKSFHTDNNYGGLNGGITNGNDLRFGLCCKPVSTLGDQAKQGRHDPCVLPRIIPVVEAMTAFVLADLMFVNRTRNLCK